jgi:hypothetical protein
MGAVMKITIELFGSHECLLDSRSVRADAADLEPAIAETMRTCINEWVLSPGDVIKISEAR